MRVKFHCGKCVSTGRPQRALNSRLCKFTSLAASCMSPLCHPEICVGFVSPVCQ